MQNPIISNNIIRLQVVQNFSILLALWPAVQAVIHSSHSDRLEDGKHKGPLTNFAQIDVLQLDTSRPQTSVHKISSGLFSHNLSSDSTSAHMKVSAAPASLGYSFQNGAIGSNSSASTSVSPVGDKNHKNECFGHSQKNHGGAEKQLQRLAFVESLLLHTSPSWYALESTPGKRMEQRHAAARFVETQAGMTFGEKSASSGSNIGTPVDLSRKLAPIIASSTNKSFSSNVSVLGNHELKTTGVKHKSDSRTGHGVLFYSYLNDDTGSHGRHTKKKPNNQEKSEIPFLAGKGDTLLKKRPGFRKLPGIYVLPPPIRSDSLQIQQSTKKPHDSERTRCSLLNGATAISEKSFSQRDVDGCSLSEVDSGRKQNSLSHLEPGVVEPQETRNAWEVPGNMTDALYEQDLAVRIERVLRREGRRVPVINFRWHIQEPFLDAAAHVLNAQGRAYFYIVVGEFTKTPLRRMGFFQSKSIVSLGPIREQPTFKKQRSVESAVCYLEVPSFDELIGSSLHTLNTIREEALSQLGVGNAVNADGVTFARNRSSSCANATTGSLQTKEQSRKTWEAASFRDANHSNILAREKPHAVEKENEWSVYEDLLPRWVPYGISRNCPTRQRSGASASLSPLEVQGVQEVSELVKMLQQEMPSYPIVTDDGRDIVIVVNDRLPETELLLKNAFIFAPHGTPVIVMDNEDFRPDEFLPRIRLRSPTGEQLFFVVFGYGRYGQIPLDVAFLEHSIVRVPKAADILSFLERYGGNRPKEEHIKTDPDSDAAYEVSRVIIQREAKKKRPNHFSANIPSINFIILNPFQEFVLRFNYTEVDSLTAYAAAIVEELRHTPLIYHRRNGSSARVVVLLLTEFSEAETLFPPSLLKLNLILHVTIAVTMLIALLSGLCMCRMMYLLKSRWQQ